jgi:hypothetical protein
MNQNQGLFMRWRKVSLPNKLTVFCTIVIAMATVFYSCAAYRQLGAMERTIGQMKNSGDSATHQTWQLIGNINWLAKAMDGSLRETQRAVDNSISAMHIDQRAWISVSAGPTAVTSGEFIEAPIDVLNIGKTPARHLDGDIITTVLSDNEVLDTSYRPGHLRSHTSGGTFLPNSKRPPIISRAIRLNGKDTADIVANPILVEDIQAGKMFVVIYGKLSYSDVFGSNHWITFCLAGTGIPKKINGCAEYNEVDTQ